ncbi:hypothetical protein Ahy_A02g009278 isoform F [Arachis hypogaea]|uniref:Protein NPGR2 n=1 Tax=Arachis hypogaea TaxID=3818 RepID=A0A445EGI8_ARAHY|nr:hypothetical protein Ahy_A02g009278 isoform F [Arachis hypogaea]
MRCLQSGEPLGRAVEMVPSSESVATSDCSASGHSCLGGQIGNKKPDTGNIEEAESSLRESGVLNYEEARALLGRYEYQKGNLVAALHVFEGIDIVSVTPKIKDALSKSRERRKRYSQNNDEQQMSVHAVALLLEAVFLKAKSLQETLSKAVELLPELWKLADCQREAILSYRRALLHEWNLDAETIAKIQKEFALFLLYSGGEAMPPDLRSQMDGSFVPRNNIEEAILLLMILLRKVTLNRIEWDPSILDHLSFALSVSGDLMILANQLEELLPGTIHRKERFYALALCYYGAGKNVEALDLLRKLLSNREDPRHVPSLLMASKICCENFSVTKDPGVSFARMALENLDGRCNQLENLANFLLGVSLSAYSKLAISDAERVKRQSEALHTLETACKLSRMEDPVVLYHLSLEYAEQRKLDAALHYAKCIVKLEVGSNVKGWLLLSRVLSAQKRFLDAESIINAALDQTGKWDQGDLLRTKAKLQIAQGQLKSAIETYTQLLAVLQVHSKSFGSRNKLFKDKRDQIRNLEVEVWHDLAYVYISLSQWRDAEACLSKSRAIKLYSSTRCHAIGKMYEAKGLYKEALKAFRDALDIDPDHVPSLISTAMVLRHCSDQSNPAVRSFLMDALRHDRFCASAWYNLGLLHKAYGTESAFVEGAECFQAAHSLEESEPVEPFR